MSNQEPQLLSELLKPQTIDELALAKENIRRLNEMISQGNIMNMIFHGGTGTGKTTGCKIILKTIAPENTVRLSGAAAWNMDIITQIDSYAGTRALFGGRKACLIDEVDLLPKKVQNALRSVLDKKSANIPFLFTANDMRKVIAAVQSRALLLSFDVAPSDCAEVKERLRTRYMRILVDANIPYDLARLERIIDDHFPDLRTIANSLQWEFGSAAAA
jgi:replication-associated recombination protein RarA